MPGKEVTRLLRSSKVSGLVYTTTPYTLKIVFYFPTEVEANLLDGQINSSKSQLDTKVVVSSPTLKVYKRRFYILAVYSLACILQVIVWNTWAPIAETSKL